MIADKTAHRPYRIIVELKPPHNIPRDLLADQGTSLKVIPPVLISRLHGRFPHVMKEHGKPQNLIPFDILKRQERMARHIVLVVRGILLYPHHGVPLRQDHFGDSQLVCVLNSLRMGGNEQLHQFCLNPLRADLLQGRCKFSHRLRSLLLNREIKLGGKAHCTQNSQSVLRKSLLRITHTADQMMV